MSCFFAFPVIVSIVHPEFRLVNWARLILVQLHRPQPGLGQYLSPISANDVGQDSANFGLACD